MQQQLSPINIKVVSAILLLVVAIAQSLWLHLHLHFDLEIALTDAFGSYVVLYAILLFVDKGFNYFMPAASRFVIIGVQSIGLSFVWVYLFGWTILSIFQQESSYTLFWKDTEWLRIFIGWLILTQFSVINDLSHRILKESDSKEQNLIHEQMRKEAELYKLRQQLHPHFLFNSLNSINALIGKEPAQARAMLHQLSELLRQTLKKEDDDLIAFSDEMKDMQLYLAIEKVRFGHRLLIEENIAESCKERKIPPFLLQPLLENAIKYGLYGSIGTVCIKIKVHCEPNYLHFSITNPFDTTAISPRGTGFGLDSIKRRLYLLFARNDLLKIDKSFDPNNKEMGTFTANLTIPIS